MWSVETLPMAGVNRRRGFNFPSDEEAIKEAEAAEHASQARAEAQAITLAQNAGQRPVNRSGTYITSGSLLLIPDSVSNLCSSPFSDREFPLQAAPLSAGWCGMATARSGTPASRYEYIHISISALS